MTIIADFGSDLSLSKMLRDLVIALNEANVPYQTYDIGSSAHVEKSGVLLTPAKDFRILRFSHILDLFSSPLPAGLRRQIGHLVFWEFNDGLLEAFPSLNSQDTVVVMSDYNQASIRDQLMPTTPVCKILYPFRLPCETPEDAASIRMRYGIGAEEFVVFFNFSYGSSLMRKNPNGVMRAFAKAFGADNGVRLVFKTMRAKEFPGAHDKLAALTKKLDIADRFTSIDAYIPHKDIYSLTNACDVYISLHRGEGFGLGVAEAMAFGKPVIVSDYSATTEFCNSENSFPVPCRIRRIESTEIDHPCYLGVRTVAEPDEESAAQILRSCRSKPDLRSKIGKNAREFIFEHFSNDNFRKSIFKYLNSDREGCHDEI